MEPRPIAPEIIEQDFLLDTIKEYRKILSYLLVCIRGALSNECKSVLEMFNVSLLSGYEYAYSGVENIQIDVDAYKEEIRKIMDCLENQDNGDSKNIYQECYQSYIYQYYYLENHTI
tara:strand:- start:415 stop:765 length:351 start_codon:yes stop_codon:yes gene_type:complete